MAFEHKLGSLKEINDAGDRIYLGDATGVVGETYYIESDVNEDEYLARINSTGYGGVNPARESLALFIIGQYRTTKGDVEVTFDYYDPLTAKKFVARVIADGWYRFHLLAITKVLDKTTMENGTVAYDLVDNRLIKKIDDLTYEAVVPSDLRDSSYASKTAEQFFVANNTKLFHNLNRQVVQLRKLDSNGSNAREIARVKDILDTTDGVLLGSIYEYVRGNKYIAQENIEYLNTNVDRYVQH